LFVRIGLVVDHPKRDLAGSVLLAYQLARRSASVVIVPMYEQAVDVPNGNAGNGTDGVAQAPVASRGK